MAVDVALGQRALTVLLNLAVAVAVGAAATRLCCARLPSPWSRLQERRARAVLLAALATAIAASAGGLWLTAAAIAELAPAAAGGATWTMLTATHLGVAFQLGMAALIASMAAAGAARRPVGLSVLSLAALAAFLYTRSMVSHAADDGDFSLRMLVDWLHLLFICLWVGEVMMAALMVLPAWPIEALAARADCRSYIQSLSRAATVALAAILVTGLLNAGYNLGSPRALLGNPYGSTLLIKLALVLGAAALGGINRFLVMPQLDTALQAGAAAARMPGRRFIAILRAEALLLLLALMAAAMLSATAPPGS